MQSEHRVLRQAVAVVLSIAALVGVVLLLPVSEATRGQLLQLLGILIAAGISIASSTFIGNALAGLLLRGLRHIRVGDFLQVGENFGRVSVQALFRTEIQTEQGDLVSVPNLYLTTPPVRLIPRNGTLVSAEVGLGYDVHRGTVESLLLQAARAADLHDAFVLVGDLGDFSVTYRVAGLLPDPGKILRKNSELRGAILDAFHGAGVEIVSPNFMNQRVVTDRGPFIPEGKGIAVPARSAAAAKVETVVFSKAERAKRAADLEEAREGKEEDPAEAPPAEEGEGTRE